MSVPEGCGAPEEPNSLVVATLFDITLQSRLAERECKAQQPVRRARIAYEIKVTDSEPKGLAPELSIGTLSEATGVPVDTLRTWERRYGFPLPISRTEGSHRRYGTETVQAVQLVVRALRQGHRASRVVGLGAAELIRLIDVGPPEGRTHRVERPVRATSEPRASDLGAPEQTQRLWVELTRALDGPHLQAALQEELARCSVLEFLSMRLSPFLAEVGHLWSRGQLRIYQEHFVTELVVEFLRARWTPLTVARRGAPAVVLATPPGEQHTLGLHMTAWVASLSGARIVFLGADAPMSEVAFAVRESQARAVALSVSSWYAGDLKRLVDELLSQLPPDVELRLGGAGSRRLGSSELVLKSFLELGSWVDHLVSAPSSAQVREIEA